MTDDAPTAQPTVVTVAEASAELRAQIDGLVDAAWPAFMLHDDTVNRLWHHLYDDWPGLQVLLVRGGSEVVGVGNTIPFPWDGQVATLPGGVDDVLERGVAALRAGAAATAVSALQAVVRRDLLGRGLSAGLVSAMKEHAVAFGASAFVAPVRPTRKADHPRVPMEDYVARTRDDGAPVDPWLRVHWRLGARVLGVCPRSMLIRGTVGEWTAWTGMAFPLSGSYEVAGGLAPVAIDLDADEGVYVEPNVWVQHPV